MNTARGLAFLNALCSALYSRIATYDRKPMLGCDVAHFFGAAVAPKRQSRCDPLTFSDRARMIWTFGALEPPHDQQCCCRSGRTANRRAPLHRSTRLGWYQRRDHNGQRARERSRREHQVQRNGAEADPECAVASAAVLALAMGGRLLRDHQRNKKSECANGPAGESAERHPEGSRPTPAATNAHQRDTSPDCSSATVAETARAERRKAKRGFQRHITA